MPETKGRIPGPKRGKPSAYWRKRYRHGKSATAEFAGEKLEPGSERYKQYMAAKRWERERRGFVGRTRKKKRKRQTAAQTVVEAIQEGRKTGVYRHR